MCVCICFFRARSRTRSTCTADAEYTFSVLYYLCMTGFHSVHAWYRCVLNEFVNSWQIAVWPPNACLNITYRIQAPGSHHNLCNLHRPRPWLRSLLVFCWYFLLYVCVWCVHPQSSQQPLVHITQHSSVSISLSVCATLLSTHNIITIFVSRALRAWKKRVENNKREKYGKEKKWVR